MKYEKLGHTEIKVSKLAVGCMSMGEASTMHDWTLNATDSEILVKKALDHGINFFDTANIYSRGTSETFLGRAIKNNVAREKVVLASKVYFNDFNFTTNSGNLSKEQILREIDGTLARLQTDYLDLYIIHRFDNSTAIEETMEVLNSLVKSGKVRALGASAMYGYQFHNMQHVALQHHWTLFASMQNHYNLLYREDERELIPICKQYSVSLTPYSPLAAGRLSRLQWHANTKRSQTDQIAVSKYDSTEKEDYKIVKRVHELAEKRGATMSQISLAWHFAKGVTSPIIGATQATYLDDAVGALNIHLTREEVDDLEALYRPHQIVGAL